MLATAAASTARAGFASRIALAQADATAFDPQGLFGCASFERVMISYALSMIPPWHEALAHALDVVAPGGSLQIVDFGDCAGLPRPFKAGLRQWLAMFDVTPRDDLAAALEALAAERGMSMQRSRAGFAATRSWRPRGDGASRSRRALTRQTRASA